MAIAFTRVQEDVDRPGSDYRLEAEIWLMNADGSEPRRLTYNTSDDYGVAWSPDGATLAFGASQFRPDGRGGLDLATQAIYLMSIAGGGQVPLTGMGMRAQFPSWGPGGTIAFHGTRAGGSAEIFLIEPDGTSLRQLTDNEWTDARPDWSPDGGRIAFQSNRDGNLEIFSMTADGSDVLQLSSTSHPAANQAPDWSPDGRVIVFQSTRDGNPEIYRMAADGTALVRLTDYAGRDLDPEWSPDGRKILFDRDIPPIERGIRELFIMNRDGSEARPVTGLPSVNGHAAWRRGDPSPP